MGGMLEPWTDMRYHNAVRLVVSLSGVYVRLRGGANVQNIIHYKHKFGRAALENNYRKVSARQCLTEASKLSSGEGFLMSSLFGPHWDDFHSILLKAGRRYAFTLLRLLRCGCAFVLRVSVVFHHQLQGDLFLPWRSGQWCSGRYLHHPASDFNSRTCRMHT
jgi:hypothetical protein